MNRMFRVIVSCALGLVLGTHAAVGPMQPGSSLWGGIQKIAITADEIESSLDNLQDPLEDLIIPLEDLADEAESLVDTFEDIESKICHIATTIDNIDETLINIDDDLDCLLAIADKVEVLDKVASDVDVVAHEVQSTLDVLEDIVEDIDDQIFGIESQIDEIDETVEIIDSKIDTLQDIADEIDDTVNAVASTLDDIDTRLIDIDDTALEIESTLDGLQPTLESILDGVEQLNETTSIIDSKVDVIEEVVREIEEQVSSIENIVEDIDMVVEDIESTLDQLVPEVENIESIVEGIESVLDIIEDVVLDIEENTQEIASTLDSIEDKVMDIQDTVESIQDTVEIIDSKVDVLISISEIIETNVSIIESISEVIDTTVSIIDNSVEDLGSLEESILDKVCMLVEQGCTFLISQEDIDNAGPNNPYQITEPGTYCVTEGLVSGCKQMIHISADCVTLDLKGYCLEGDPGHDVICVEDSMNVIIKNGFIKGGNVGVHVTNSSEVLLTELKFSDSEDEAIRIEDSERVMVANCHTVDTGDSGIVITGESSKCVIKDTLICSPQSYAAGIVLDEEVSNCCIFSSKVTESRGNGFQDMATSEGNGGNIFLSCVAQESRRAGFVIGSCSVVRECNAIANAIGFEIIGDSSVIRTCVAECNTDAGIVVGGGADNSGILSNYVVGVAPETCTGISDMGAQTRVFNNLVQNCTTNYAGNVPLTEEDPTTQTGYWANIDLL